MKVLCYVFGVVDGLQDLWYVFLRLFRLYALGGGGGCGGGGAAGCVASAPNQSWLTSPLRVLQLH